MQLSLIQLVSTTVLNWAIFGYSIIQMFQAGTWIPEATLKSISNPHPTFKAEIGLITILFCFCLGWVYLTYKLYFVFGWTTYKEMGADVEVKSKYTFLI